MAFWGGLMSEPVDVRELLEVIAAEAAYFRERGIGVAEVGMGQRAAVVVVDLQRLFTTGKAAGEKVAEAISGTRRLCDAARKVGTPVVWVRTVYRDPSEVGLVWGTKVPGIAKCAPGSEHVQIDERLDVGEHEPIVEKRRASAFFGTELHAFLQSEGVDTLLLAGTSTSGCVRATAVDGAQLDYRVLVVRECTVDRSDISKEVSLADIASRYGDVLGLEAVERLLVAGGTPT